MKHNKYVLQAKLKFMKLILNKPAAFIVIHALGGPNQSKQQPMQYLHL